MFDKVKQLQEQKEQVESQLRIASAIKGNVPSVEQIVKLIEDVLEMDITTLEGKKAIADIMISKIYLYDDKLTVVFKDPEGKSQDIPLSALENPEDDCILSASGSQSRHIQTVLIVKGCMIVTKDRF